MKALRLTLAAAVLTWTVAAQAATGWVGIPFINGDTAEVPDLVGLSASAADTAAEAVGLDTTVVLSRCSIEPADEVLAQDPDPGEFVALATVIDLETSNGVACMWDTTGIPTGWYSLPTVLAEQDFVALMRQEADGSAVWAYWLPGAPRGTANLRLDMQIIRAEATTGGADWARWAPGTQPGNSGNLQLNMVEALNNNFE